jgi:hypothetical protein
MNIQQSPQTTKLTHLLNEVDAAIGESKGLANRPSENHRMAITACVDGLVTNQADKIEALRKGLDMIQQRALQSAAKAKAALQDHIAITDRLDDEIQRMQDVVADLVEDSREA